jgi:putative ABC transport system ATP-binding protein
VAADLSSGDSGALLEVSGLRRAFVSQAETVWAVRDVSLAAHAGQFLCVQGASGSGKSTLIRLIAGLLPADSGRIVVDATEVGPLSEADRAKLRLETVGVVFQDDRLIEEFTVKENVSLPLEVRGMKTAEAFSRASVELARVNLSDVRDRLPGQLSGGQRQRVGIARALVGGRRILLADEPTGALDSKSAREVFELFRELCDDGMLAVVCSHDPLCQEYADVVLEMVDGRLHERSPAVVRSAAG